MSPKIVLSNGSIPFRTGGTIMNKHTNIRQVVTIALALLCCPLAATAQSKLSCQVCHPNEKTDWSQGRHSNTQADVAGELAMSWKGQAPDSVINGSSAENCVACHGPVAVSAGTGMTEVQVMEHFFTTTGGLYTDSTTVADTLNWPHVGCVTCHNVPVDHPASMPSIAKFNSTTVQYDSIATSSILCGQCHGRLRFPDTDHQIYDSWKASRHGHRNQVDIAGELAANWAGQAPDSVINGSAAENCIACHAPTSVPQKGKATEVDVLKRFFTTTGGVFTASTTVADTLHWPDMACNGCHNPHNPGKVSYYNSSTKDYTVMSPDSLCGQCHGSLRFPETDHRSYDLERGTGAIGVADKITMPGVACVDCHMGKSDIDGTNSLMFKGHRWTPIVREPDGSSFASCTKCHAAMVADSALAQIGRWKSEYVALDSIANLLVPKADSIANVQHDSTKMQLVAAAQHNLAMAETDESGGFHNHLYSVALLNDAAARARVVTGVAQPQPGSQLPMRFALLQNYPNPFNPSTVIRYALPQRSRVTLTIYNTVGQQVRLLAAGEEEAGYHEVKFDGSNLASGVYFYRLQAGTFVGTKKLLLIR
jgi:hypothetical protein